MGLPRFCPYSRRSAEPSIRAVHEGTFTGKAAQGRRVLHATNYRRTHGASAFHALRRDGTAHQARVLDPAAGAGDLLIAAFRQIVRERWVCDGVRPDTNVLRHILYHQIVGFDINEEALRFAALGLYLISIELILAHSQLKNFDSKKICAVVFYIR